MTRIRLAIEGDCCGAMSVGTVAVIRAVQRHLGLSLSDSSAYVDRCVFEGQEVTLTAPNRAAADALLAEFEQLPAAARIRAHLAD